MRLARLLLLVLTLAGSAVACGDDDGGGLADGGGGGEVSGVDDPSSFAALLSELPASASETSEDFPLVVQATDYAGAADAAGLEVPEAGAGQDALVDYFRGLSIGGDEEPGVGVAMSNLTNRTAIEDEAWRTELGWAPVDVEQSIETQGEDQIYVFHGDFDPEAIDEAVRSDPAWSDQLEVAEHAGVEFYTWGEDDDVSENITPVRDLGRGGRMAVLGNDTIVWTWATEPMTDTLEVLAGDAASLADDSNLVPVAEAMDDADALSTMLVDGPVLAGPDVEGLTDDLGDDETGLTTPSILSSGLQPYEALATGVTLDDEGPQVLLAFGHADDETAEANAEQFEETVAEGESVSGQPWADLVSLASAEVEDAVLLARLEPADPDEHNPNLWATVLFQRDSLVAI